MSRESDDTVIAALDVLRRAARDVVRRSDCTLLIFESPGFACLVGVETGASAVRAAYERETGAKRRGS